MSGLAKATLAEVEIRQGDVVDVRDEVEVQFNPASLRISLTNENEGGKTRGRQARQFTGQSATELSFDLVFDTADETGEDGTARSVRERTAMVERFLLPKGEGEQKQTPPMVRFHWGHLVLDGVISSLSMDFELFSPDGIPLRAKMAVSIREQDPKYTYLERGPGANEAPAGDGDEGRPGEPGTAGGGTTDRSAAALAGESAAEFAARVGLDPSRWRALAAGLENPLSLEAGVEIGFSASLSAELGAGIKAGVHADASASLEASLGLEVESGGRLEAGRSLARSGGVAAALDTAKSSRAEAAARASVRAFAAPESSPGSPPERTAASLGVGTGAGARTTPPAGAGPSSGAGAVRPSVDPRAVSYGQGIPLRPRLTGAADERRDRLRGTVRPGKSPETAVTGSPDTPPWTRLPATDPGRREADREQDRREKAGPCGCRCPAPGRR